MSTSINCFSVSWLKAPIEYSTFESICAAYANPVSAEVRWFDRLSGEGFIRLTEGPLLGFSVFVHGSAFGGDPNFGQGTAFEATNGLQVTVKLFIDCTFIQVSNMTRKVGA